MRQDTQTSPNVSGAGRRNTTRTPSAPLGIKIIAVLGIIGSLLSAIGGLALFGYGVVGLVLGLVVVGIAVLQAYVLVELVSMTPWAHPWAVGLYGFGTLINLLTFNLLGALLSALIAGYIWSKADLYRR